jgi:hypothetical protein
MGKPHTHETAEVEPSVVPGTTKEPVLHYTSSVLVHLMLMNRKERI